METTDFKGKLVKQKVESEKLKEGQSIRTLTLADLHGYTNDLKRTIRLIEYIQKQQPEVIFIAGDIFSGGSSWENSEKLKSFEYFIRAISEIAPVCITWGNHDLRGIKTDENLQGRIKRFKNLENVRSGNVFPLYNDRVFVKGMEVIGYVPRFELMEKRGLKIQVHGLAHDEFIADYNREGVKFSNQDGVINVYLGHDPHLIAASENGIGLGDLSSCDFFITGHLHDGYRLVVEYLERLKTALTGKGFKSLDADNSLLFDRGFTDQPSYIVDKDGKKIKRKLFPIYLGKINLCRGIVYIDNNAQQRIWQSPEGKFYINITNEPNQQDWQPIDERHARSLILSNNFHYMLISEGVTPLFKPTEKFATMNEVEITGKSRTLAR